MRKRREESDHGGSERWLLTYADMITLLMAFFIMMYSMSVLNVSKFQEAAISIRSGFGGTIKGQGKSILGSSGRFSAKPSPIQGDTAGVSWHVLKRLVNYVEKDSNAKSVSVGEDRRGIVITLSTDSMLFDPGSATLQPLSREVLDKVAEMLGEAGNLVRVEGHTCDLPPRSPRFASNWELSTARATEVLRYLVESNGLDAARFSAAGYANVRPIAPNDKEENRRKNRRVEIVLIRPEFADDGTPRMEPRRISDPNRISIQRRLD